VTGFARHVGQVRGHGRVHGSKSRRELERSIHKAERKNMRKAAHAGSVLPAKGGHKNPLSRLHWVGREVGNPIQVSLAGWLIAMASAGGLGVARLVRRLQHLS
jgi:hypothetical protein